MEFNRVKSKLNLLYSGSLLFILLIFIIVLYLLISGAIKKQEIEQLNRFFDEEKHDFVEEIYKNRHERAEMVYEKEDRKDKEEKEEKEDDDDSDGHEYGHVEYKPERGIFYYLFDNQHNLIQGEETVSGLAQYLYQKNLYSTSPKLMKEIEWEKKHLLIISYPLKEGDDLGSVTIGMDITDEKHLIQNIIWILLLLTFIFSLLFALAGNFFAGQAMKPILKAFNTQKKFVSDASHELRTPLSIFYTSIDILSKEDHLSPFGKEILEDVKNESEMMNHLLNDLLFLARNDQGNFELDLEELELSLLMSTLLNRFNRIVPSNLSLEENIQSAIVMKGDKVRIQQLIYILLDNAVRYTKEGTIACSLNLQGREIVLSIKDTGPGIPKDDIIHIFDRFYRVDSSRKRDGSGLGLSIAKTIVDAHGGKIEVKSELGKGTEFIVKFMKK